MSMHPLRTGMIPPQLPGSPSYLRPGTPALAKFLHDRGNDDIEATMQIGGALASPSTAYLYDWNLLPLGQALWRQELETYQAFPPLQAPESYNLDQVIQQVREAKTASHVGQ